MTVQRLPPDVAHRQCTIQQLSLTLVHYNLFHIEDVVYVEDYVGLAAFIQGEAEVNGWL